MRRTLLAMLWLPAFARPNDGPLYFAIQRGRNVADLWARVRDGKEAVVSVLDSWGGQAPGVKRP